MAGLHDINLAPSYRKGDSDIAGEFYLPCMTMASRYDRAVGFFSSTIYSIAWSALKGFVERGGMMRIICSHVLSPDDIESLEKGYSARQQEEAETRILTEVHSLLGSPHMEKPSKVLASLVALEVIELKVAFVSQKNIVDMKRLFHDKLGIFSDTFGNSVVFKGSMNETWSGLSNDGNLESVDVFVSWESEREKKRIEYEKDYFDRLWENKYPTVTVKAFPEVAREKLISCSDTREWERLVDEIVGSIEKPNSVEKDQSQNTKPIQRAPRPHQIKALENWNNHNRRGIFEHATGSGKTFTALCAIVSSLEKGEVPIILVPSDLLISQWLKEIKETLFSLNPKILICGSGHSEWRSEILIGPWTRSKLESDARMVLATLQTASSDDFLSMIRQGEHLFMVCDEVHRIGSPRNQRLLEIETGPRLGLSATPRRAGDPEGTQRIFDYFDGIIPPVFTLKDAIPSALTPYFYYVHPIRLTDDEQVEWTDISRRVSRFSAMQQSGKSKDFNLDRRIKMLLIARARIVKAAENKMAKATEVIRNNYEPGQRWIIYCDSLPQLQQVTSNFRSLGMPAVEFHSEMLADREQTIRIFEANGGILVSIRCLDEGVDIPSVSHALILASSKNPREFIQRRGRVLRKAEDKNIAYIHDVLVLPNSRDDGSEGLSIIESELARAIEFGKWGENPSSITDLERIALEMGMDYRLLANGGFEDDEDEE